MSGERVIAVTAPIDDGRRILLKDTQAASARARKADPGDRGDIIRFEAMSTELEAWAIGQIGKDDVVVREVTDEPDVGGQDHPPTPLLDGDRITVTVRLPFETGRTPELADNGTIIPPRQPWSSPDGSTGKRATRQRFEAQCAAALDPGTADQVRICPSGINNAVITDVLWKYVALRGDPIDVPVEYRDGSRSRHPFAFRGVALDGQPSVEHDLELRLALLSIRHTEMDTVIDGAWLRNTEVAKPRKEAETDDYVYQTSVEQLDRLTRGGSRRVKIELYQTGLEAAIIGFYRAVTEQLRHHPSSISITPVYFQASGQRYLNGKSWSTTTVRGAK